MQPRAIVGINFDHMHMGDNLRMAFEHPQARIVGLCDENLDRVQAAAQAFGVPSDRLFTDYRTCLETCKPDLALLCPATATHGDWVEKVAPFGVHILMEKPFAATLAEADRMIAAMKPTGKILAINWPLAWYPVYLTSKRLIDEGVIGRVIEIHFYDGNRGPLFHRADKIEVDAATVDREKPSSWFYSRALGGGSLLDYLGYGATLGTWFMDGEAPIEVTCVVDQPKNLEVDEHSVTVARYERGLSKFETRWGTFTDPWIRQPQPKCGFVIVGEAGTIAAYDYEPTIRLQTRQRPEGFDLPVDDIRSPFRNPVEYVLHRIETGSPIAGPLSVEISRIGQRIVDTAYASAQQKRTLPLIG